MLGSASNWGGGRDTNAPSARFDALADVRFTKRPCKCPHFCSVLSYIKSSLRSVCCLSWCCIKNVTDVLFFPTPSVKVLAWDHPWSYANTGKISPQSSLRLTQAHRSDVRWPLVGKQYAVEGTTASRCRQKRPMGPFFCLSCTFYLRIMTIGRY